MNIKIRKLHENAVIPRYATEGAAGFDLVAVEDTIIEPGETKLIRTGLAFEIPPGYEMQIREGKGMSKVKTWIITVGGGYGSFEFVGTEEEAEEMRRHKAEWEGAVARKRPKSEICHVLGGGSEESNETMKGDEDECYG